MDQEKKSHYIEENWIWVLTICAIGVLFAFSVYAGSMYGVASYLLMYISAPILATVWLIVANVPSWIDQTSHFYLDATIMPQDKMKLIGSILMSKVNESMTACKNRLIYALFVDSVYDQDMRKQTLHNDLVWAYIKDARKYYREYSRNERKSIEIMPSVINKANTKAIGFIKGSDRFKKTTFIFWCINVFLLAFTIVVAITVHAYGAFFPATRGTFLLYITLYSLGAIIYGMYIIPICTLKHRALFTRYIPTDADILNVLDRLENNSDLTPEEREIKAQIDSIESKTWFAMQDILEGKMNYFTHYDAYWKATHNDMMDYHYLIKPFPDGNSSADGDVLIYNPYYYNHTSSYDPNCQYSGAETGLHSFLQVYGKQHPDIDFSEDEKNKFRGEALEYSTFIQLAMNSDRYGLSDYWLESGILVPKLDKKNPLPSEAALAAGKSSEIDIVYLNKKGIFVIECKNFGGTIRGNIYTNKNNYNTYLQYARPNDEFHDIYSPILQNKTHINTLRWQLKENVFQKENRRLPFYNIIVTSDCLDINQLNYTHKSQQHEDRMYWVRYGKLEEWLKMISQFEDVLSPSDISQIGNYLKIWRYPTEANLQAHIENSKKNNREESNNFFV